MEFLKKLLSLGPGPGFQARPANNSTRGARLRKSGRLGLFSMQVNVINCKLCLDENDTDHPGLNLDWFH
jgi:hypothetical protein